MHRLSGELWRIRFVAGLMSCGNNVVRDSGIALFSTRLMSLATAAAS